MKSLILFLTFVIIFLFSRDTIKLFAQPNPIICMPFNMNAMDISGNNHHGIVTGATLTSDRFGNPNSAFDFDGVDDHIQIIDSLGSYLPDDEVSIVFWARANSIWNNSPILLLPNDNGDRLNIHIHYDNTGTHSTFWDYGNISGGGRLYIPNVPFQSVWDHYAFVMSASLDSLRVYKNGILQAGKNNVSILSDRSRLLNIGGGISDVTNCHFNGQIDDVQIFNVALTASEVNYNYINSGQCITVGIDENISAENSMYVFPNPVDSKVKIKIIGSGNSSFVIEILDITGSVVHVFENLRMVDNELAIELQNLGAGVYFVRYKSANAVMVERIMKY